MIHTLFVTWDRGVLYVICPYCGVEIPMKVALEQGMLCIGCGGDITKR
jgi:hypothetical protein